MLRTKHLQTHSHALHKLLKTNHVDKGRLSTRQFIFNKLHLVTTSLISRKTFKD